MLKAMKINCGSGLAREGVNPANIDVEWPTAIAGKPAPTGDLRLTDWHYGPGLWRHVRLYHRVVFCLRGVFRCLATGVQRAVRPEHPRHLLLTFINARWVGRFGPQRMLGVGWGVAGQVVSSPMRSAVVCLPGRPPCKLEPTGG